MDPNELAKAFVEHYYSTFDTNRAGLGNLYQEGSMLTFEGIKTQGSQNIVAKLTSLPFQQCQHTITTTDCQPSGPAGGMIVVVSGHLQLAGEQHALKFGQPTKYTKESISTISFESCCPPSSNPAAKEVGTTGIDRCGTCACRLYLLYHPGEDVPSDANTTRKLLRLQ
ncbi:hypothetical protein KY285_025431 [Solanum tuberosum]|nr:hypothetical protein KY289_025710 [Solanum tuberosum]KAH0677630.1 hypothetical protein KY285_025431 [Solanum tuberosum]